METPHLTLRASGHNQSIHDWEKAPLPAGCPIFYWVGGDITPVHISLYLSMGLYLTFVRGMGALFLVLGRYQRETPPASSSGYSVNIYHSSRTYIGNPKDTPGHCSYSPPQSVPVFYSPRLVPFLIPDVFVIPPPVTLSRPPVVGDQGTS